MTKKNLYHAAWKLRATGALVLALALSTFPAAFSRAVRAQAPAKTSAQTPAKATTSPAGESKGGQKEGIQVHGHWTIDVRNPDGKLVTHREFENALALGAATSLTEFLGHYWDDLRLRPGFWRIDLWGVLPAGPSPWSPDVGAVIAEPRDPASRDPAGIAHNLSPNLFVCIGGHASCINNAGVPQPAPPSGTLLLGGNISAESNGTITAVQTDFSLRSDTEIFSTNAFTFHQLPPNVLGLCPPNSQCEVHVVAGQIIQVTVAISFS